MKLKSITEKQLVKCKKIKCERLERSYGLIWCRDYYSKIVNDINSILKCERTTDLRTGLDKTF